MMTILAAKGISSARWTLAPEMLLHKNKHSPYMGMEFEGRVTATLVRGAVVFDGRGITADPQLWNKTVASSSRGGRRHPREKFLLRPLYQGVAAVVALVAGVSLHPVPIDGMGPGELPEFLPEVPVQHRLFPRRAPAVFAPPLQPALLEGVAQVRGVRVQLHPAGVLQRPERLDRGREPDRLTKV